MNGKRSGPSWALVFGGLALLSIAGARFLIDGWGYAAPCPFREITGLPCPTCFGLRALAEIGRGNVGEGIAAQPLVALAALAFLGWGAVSLVCLLLRRPVPKIPRISPGRRRLFLGAVLVAVLANWALLLFRN